MRTPGVEPIEDCLARFTLASREDLDRTELLRRFDAKYLLTEARLPDLLSALQPHSRLLPSRGHLSAGYRTLYFDTPGRLFFRDHLRGRRPRRKVRIRHYRERNVSFLEVKEKDNHDQTIKRRRPLVFDQNVLAAAEYEFLRAHLPFSPDPLSAAVWTDFSRVTLLSPDTCERLTIDRDVVFRRGDREHRLPGLVLVEVKQARPAARTAVMHALRAWTRRLPGFSKYCLGLSLFEAGLQTSRLRPTLRLIERTAHA